jgi:PAS domain S-box-containing protein
MGSAPFMTDTVDSASRWTRELAHLRSLKTRRGSPTPAPDIADAALGACDGLLRDLAGAQLACERLQLDVRTQIAAWERLFERMPIGCILTDAGGQILNANRAASALLNLSAKRLKDRLLLVFSEDRVAFETMLQQLRHGEDVRTSLRIRPRERKAIEVRVEVLPVSDEEPTRWLWFFLPTEASHPVTPSDLGDRDVGHPVLPLKDEQRNSHPSDDR